MDTAVRGAKHDVKEALLKDQRHVCCYCTGKIAYETMKVEHWVSQSEDPTKRLEWSNLLAACDGGERSGNERHCDAQKSSTPITLDPTRQEHINKLSYTNSGVMKSDVESIDKDIDETLNLNTPKLQRARMSAWDGFRKACEMKREKLSKDTAYTEKLLQKVRNLVDREHASPYYDIIIYFLERKQAG